MDIRLSCGPDLDGYERAIRFASRRNLRILYVFGAVVLLLGLVNLVLYAQQADAGTLSIGMLFAVLGVYIGVFYPRAAIRRAIAGMGRDGRVGHEYVITEQTLTVTSVYGRQQLSWYVFVQAREIPGQILLYVQRGRFVRIPTAGMTPEQLQQLRTFLARRDWSMELRPVSPTQPVAGQ